MERHLKGNWYYVSFEMVIQKLMFWNGSLNKSGEDASVAI